MISGDQGHRIVTGEIAQRLQEQLEEHADKEARMEREMAECIRARDAAKLERATVKVELAKRERAEEELTQRVAHLELQLAQVSSR